jgi:hypothetical protein
MTMSSRRLFDGGRIELGLLPLEAGSTPATVVTGVAAGSGAGAGSAAGLVLVAGSAAGTGTGAGAATGVSLIYGMGEGSGTGGGSAIGATPSGDDESGGGRRLPRHVAKPRTVRRTEHRPATLAVRYRLTHTPHLDYTRRQADEDTLVLLGVL